jgi:hypothetical protein
VDRESAYELMASKIAPHADDQPEEEHAKKAKPEPGFVEQVMGNTAVKSFLRSAAGALGRELTRGMFGNRRR